MNNAFIIIAYYPEDPTFFMRLYFYCDTNNCGMIMTITKKTLFSLPIVLANTNVIVAANLHINSHVFQKVFRQECAMFASMSRK